jgi:drug/metabolite transporter (DMT)-like permease
MVGLGLSGLAFLLHALALRHGDLALVQPVIVSGIVFAVLIRSGLAHRFPPPRRTIVWLVLTCAGLALFLEARPATTDQTANMTNAVAVVATGGALALVATLAALRWAAARNKGILLATATGTLYGLVAGLVKVALASGNGMLSVLTSWPLGAMVVAGIWAVLLNQRAYQSANLWVTAPIVSIGEALVSIVFGVVVFDEGSRSTAAELLGQGLGLALIIAGVIKLASTQDDEADRSAPPKVEASSLLAASPDSGLGRG